MFLAMRMFGIWAYCLQVCLDLLLLQIQFPFDLVQHLVVNASLVAESDDGCSFG